MAEYLVTKQDVIRYVKELEEGSKACTNYFIKDSNEDKIYMVYDVNTDEHGVRFTGVDVEDLSIEHRTLFYMTMRRSKSLKLSRIMRVG